MACVLETLVARAFGSQWNLNNGLPHPQGFGLLLKLENQIIWTSVSSLAIDENTFTNRQAADSACPSKANIHHIRASYLALVLVPFNGSSFESMSLHSTQAGGRTKVSSIIQGRHLPNRFNV